MTAPAPRTCGDSGGVTKSGAPCRSTLNLGASGRCVMHDESRVAERAAIRIAGGKAAGVSKRKAKAALPEQLPRRAPQTIDDAVEWSSWAMRAVAAGEIDFRIAHEVGYLVARFTESINKRDLLDKVRILNAKLAAAEKAKAAAAAK